MIDDKIFRPHIGDIQQQHIVDRYNEGYKRGVKKYSKALGIVLIIGFSLQSDISDNSKKGIHETERSRIQKTEDVVDNIIFEFKRGMHPPY